MTRQEQAIETGRRLARSYFLIRKARTEVHLSEASLAALLALAADMGQSRRLPTRPAVTDGGAAFEAAQNPGIDY